MKLIGKRSAGKPHAAFDVAGAGNMICKDACASSRPYLRGRKLPGGLIFLCYILKKLTNLLTLCNDKISQVSQKLFPGFL